MKVIDFKIKGFLKLPKLETSQNKVVKKSQIKLNLEPNQSWTTVENRNIISSFKFFNIHSSINKANQDNETVDMIELDNIWKWIFPL
jgi:hypothetical protein